jgi:Spy/CpxP family protein refolding chaperone
MSTSTIDDRNATHGETRCKSFLNSEEASMKRTSTILILVAMVVAVPFGIQALGAGEAAEGHHDGGTKAQTPASDEAASPGMMLGSGAGPGMMGMMDGPGDESESGMMGPGMMRIMMSHMMGGPAGMGRMMAGMGDGMQGRGGPRGMAQMAHMLEGLNLTPEQWDQVRGLARERLEKMADLWAQRMKLQIELAGLRWDKEVDSQKVKDLFGQKAEAQAEMFLASLGYLRELKAILSPEQLKKMEAQGF